MEYLNIVVAFLAAHGIAVASVVAVLLGLVSLAIKGKLNTFAQTTVSAVYRQGLHAATELGEEGLNWLISPAGIAYRRNLAGRAYDLVPDALVIRGIPVPFFLVKRLVSRDYFCSIVEDAFQDAVTAANKISDRSV